jgi:hypothetical protein
MAANRSPYLHDRAVSKSGEGFTVVSWQVIFTPIRDLTPEPNKWTDTGILLENRRNGKQKKD